MINGAASSTLAKDWIKRLDESNKVSEKCKTESINVTGSGSGKKNISIPKILSAR
jgi:hypothetical protein